MGNSIVSLRDISKRFGRFVAIDSVDMNIEQGEIYGLIGENGAGKSTLIRIINGLTIPSSGHLTIFGHSDPKSIRYSRSRIGYMPDANAFYPNLDAEDNLLVRCMEWGVSQANVEGILRLVGLEGAGKRRAAGFSMGMKRRLDLAIALLGDPDFLILDEPTNGLDPMGIKGIRNLLSDLNERLGKTILVSSHNLEELHKIASRYEFISHGRILRSITAEELDANCKRRLILSVCDQEQALMELRRRGTHGAYIDGDKLVLDDFRGDSGAVVKILLDAGFSVQEAYSKQQSLEEYYADLIACEGDG